MGVFPVIGVRVRYHHTIHVVYVGKHGNAYLVRREQRQQQKG